MNARAARLATVTRPWGSTPITPSPMASSAVSMRVRVRFNWRAVRKLDISREACMASASRICRSTWEKTPVGALFSA